MKLEVIIREPGTASRSTPVLFVHGMYHCARCWEEYFLPYFAQQGYVAYALSLRGHGNSEGREKLRRASLADYVSDLDQVVSNMPSTPVLIGHSMGGLLIQKYLKSCQAPAAVLLGAVSPKGLLPVSIKVLFKHPLVFLKANLTLSPYQAIGTPERYRELFFTSLFPQERVEKFFTRVQEESYRAYVDMILTALNPPDPIKRTPLLVLGGANDTSISPTEVELTAKRHNTQAEIFPMGHAMMLEEGWQAVADRILGWLDEQGY